MPRAKRTDRAEARRRHRASLDAAAGSEESEAPDEPAAAGGRGPGPQPASAAQRPSIGSAFRAAFHPLTLREDLRTFPPLLLHRAVWLPILLTIAAGALFVATDGSNALVAIVATYFVAPPALGSVFIAGFLAPRSSYLIGFVVGLASAAVAAAIVLSAGPTLSPEGIGTAVSSPSPSVVASPAPGASPSPAASATPTPGTGPTTSTEDQIIYAFLTSPPFGMFFAATAAWYRRFLKLSNPNRGRPAQRQGPDGRSRGNQRPPRRR